MSNAHNISGQVYALTVLTPILSGHEVKLSRYLDALEGGERSPLAGVPGTHFARWVVIGDVVYEGSEQGRRDHLELSRLLFTSNFDGELDPYLEALRTGLGERAEEIWGHCLGYPGHADADAFARYLRAHQIQSSLFFAAYGDRTVPDVKRSLTTRAKVVDFALRCQGLGAAELKAAFDREFGQ
ncbi:MAG: hypothetical protein M3Z06_08170 [Actinomycetota bacterium]|nr:hypothetical protein [Actinomycetota bacterium]